MPKFNQSKVASVQWCNLSGQDAWGMRPEGEALACEPRTPKGLCIGEGLAQQRCQKSSFARLDTLTKRLYALSWDENVLTFYNTGLCVFWLLLTDLTIYEVDTVVCFRFNINSSKAQSIPTSNQTSHFNDNHSNNHRKLSPHGTTHY